MALILLDEIHCSDPMMIIAALLHDGFEDTFYLDPGFIEHCFGKEVAHAVILLSKVPKEGYLERLNNHADWKTLTIKACDRLDNLRTLGATNREFVQKQVEETRSNYLPFFRRMTERTPPEERVRAYYLNGMILEKLQENEELLAQG